MKILHRKINLTYSLFTFTYYLNKKHPEGCFSLFVGRNELMLRIVNWLNAIYSRFRSVN